MSGSLVLNASYEPLSVVSARRAVVLVLRDRAVALEVRDEIWHSEWAQMQVPSVVKLLAFVRVPHQRMTAVTRRAVFARDGFRCQYCSQPADSIDHVQPRSRGGLHVWENVVACCRRCNTRKGDRFPEEAGMALSRRPRAPSPHAWVFANSGHVVDPSWESYLLPEIA